MFPNTAVLVPDVITEEQFKAALPKGMKIAITPDMLQHINNLLQDERLQQNFRDNLITFTSVMKEGKFKLESYISAVEYVSRKLLGDTNEKAYGAVFPARYNKLIADQKSDREIAAHVSAYHHSKLVGLIMAQTLTPVWVYNQSAVQEAINTQLMLMRDEKVSPKVRCDAANSLLQHLKQPEVAKVELDINVSEDDSISDLKRAIAELAQNQRDSIQSKQSSAQSVIGTVIVPKETDIVVAKA